MALVDFAGGVNNSVQRILARRLMEQQQAQALKQQEFQNQRLTAADARAQQQMEQQAELVRMQRETQAAAQADQAKQRTYAEANALGDQLPPQTFMREADPAVSTMQQGGRGALLTPAEKASGYAPMGGEFSGPMDTGENPAEAQTGKYRGFLKTASAKQQQDMQTVADRQADNDRQAARDSEAARHNAEMERLTASARAASTMPPAASPEKQNEIQDALDLIDQIDTDPALSTAVGPIDAYIGKARDLSGVNRFEALHNELVGKLQLAQAGKLRGQGTISNFERTMLKGAATALDRKLSEKDYRNELVKLREQFRRMQGPKPSVSHSPDAAGPAPATAPVQAPRPVSTSDYRKKYGY